MVNTLQANITTLGNVAKYINGRAFKPSEWEETGLPIIRIQNLTDKKAKYNYTSLKHDDKFLVKNGDLLFAWSASLGAHIWQGNEAWLNQHIFKVLPYECIEKSYLYYFLCRVVSELYTKTHGSGMVHITKNMFINTPIPVPPIQDQKRIVARIEELFSNLDSAVETLQKTKHQLEVYRQAVLREAFEGTLTEQWRISNPSNSVLEIMNLINAESSKKRFVAEETIELPLLPKQWKWINIGNITDGVEYGTSKKSSKEGDVPVIRMGNIQNGKIDWTDLVYTSDEEEINKYALSKGDVLFNRTNSPELVGKTAIFQSDCKAIFAGYLIRINQFDFINPKYLNYYLNSHIARSYGNKVKTDGVNQSNINGKKLCSYPFPLCSYEEQTQIVYELSSRLSVCENIEKTVDEALQQAEAIRQSILKQAFEN